MTIKSLLPLTLLALTPMTAADECRPIDGIRPLLRPGHVLLLGELHGTAESPAFLLDVACHAAGSGNPIVVGLELPTTERDRIAAFLDSSGSEDDRRQLLSGPIWQASYQDGRASWAMLDLIDGLRRLRRAGVPLQVVPFDPGGRGGGQQRDRGMGRILAAEVKAAPQAIVIVLTGNMHSRITQGRVRDPEYEPMGYVLDRAMASENLVSLDVARGAGSAWICAPDCGISELRGYHGERRWEIEIDEATRPAGHHGWYHVGEISASLPARMSPVPVALESSATDPIRPGESPTPTPPRGLPEAAEHAPETPHPLSAAESKFQGAWQAYDYGSASRTWKMRFDARRFRAEGGPDDWYEGTITIRSDVQPPELDFVIEDCRCSFKGMTSQAIFSWDGESIVIAAPRPGAPRPARFSQSSGEMMRLRRLD